MTSALLIFFWILVATPFEVEMRAGDEAYARFATFDALAAYTRAAAIEAENRDVLWKLARAHADAGSRTAAAAQKEHFAAAERFARRCIALHPDSAEGHFILAVALGRVALGAGGRRKIELGRAVKAEAERALELDPRHDGAMHVLGRWNYEVGTLNWLMKATARVVYGGVPEGTLPQARDWFEKALGVNPKSPVHHLWLGEAFVKLGEYERARQQFEECLKLPDQLWEDPSNKRQAARSRDEIARW